MFKKGESGNPGGRPKIGKTVKELAKRHTIRAFKTLVDIMNDPQAPTASRALAANSVLDRGYGKPTQYVEQTTTILDSLCEAELQRLADAIATIREQTGGTLSGGEAAVESSDSRTIN